MRKLGERARDPKGLTPGLPLAYQHAMQSKLFLQFRSGDMKAEDWSVASRLDRLLTDMGTMLYF